MEENENIHVDTGNIDTDESFEQQREKAQMHLLEQLFLAVRDIAQKDADWEQQYTVFLPMEAIPREKEHIRQFNDAIKVFRMNNEWDTHVTREKMDKRFPGNHTVQGIEYVFLFREDTKYRDILEYLDKQIAYIKTWHINTYLLYYDH